MPGADRSPAAPAQGETRVSPRRGRQASAARPLGVGPPAPPAAPAEGDVSTRRGRQAQDPLPPHRCAGARGNARVTLCQGHGGAGARGRACDALPGPRLARVTPCQGHGGAGLKAALGRPLRAGARGRASRLAEAAGLASPTLWGRASASPAARAQGDARLASPRPPGPQPDPLGSGRSLRRRKGRACDALPGPRWRGCRGRAARAQGDARVLAEAARPRT